MNHNQHTMTRKQTRQFAGIGETVLDIVLRDNQPQAAVPGGSVFNTMVSLGRTVGREFPEVHLTLASQTGNDAVSERVISFMAQNRVSTDGIQRAHGQSTISLAFLDSGSNARYEFYRDKDLPPFRTPDIPLAKEDIVVFGSFFAVSPVTGKPTREFISRAREQGAIVYYDINFRPNHRVEAEIFERNIALSDIVRASSDDIGYLYGSDDAARVYEEHIAPLCRNFICTRGAADAEMFSPDARLRLPVPKVERIVSTIGAGDSFNAGVIYALIRHGYTKDRLRSLSDEDWGRLATPGMRFSANVCASIHNYVDPDFRP